MCTHEWFMMGCADNNSIIIGGLSIERIIIVKSAAPHCGPQIVGFEPQHEFKYFFIKFMVEAAELHTAPVA